MTDTLIPFPAPASPAPGPFPDPVEKLIPFGSTCTLSGASGVGKTAFIASLIAKLQNGEEIFGHITHPPTAIGVLACDRPWRDHAAWFEKARCKPFIHRSLRDEDYQWDLFRDYKHVHLTFGGLIDDMQLPPGALLITDPVSLFLPGRLIDYKDMAIAMGLVDNQTRQRHLTHLGIFHTSKQKGGPDRYQRPQDRILGSAALIGFSETTFYLMSPDDAQKPHFEFGYSCHQLPPASFAYKRDPLTGLFLPAEHLDLVHDQEVALSLLPEYPTVIARSIWIAKIREAIGCSIQQAEALIKQLRYAGRVEKTGRALYRRVKPH